MKIDALLYCDGRRIWHFFPSYRQREVVAKIVFLQSFENQHKSIHQSSNPPKSGY